MAGEGRAAVGDEGVKDNSDPAQTVTPVKKRRWGRTIVIAVVVLGVLAALLFLAPAPIARLVARNQLDALGIESEGIETLDIDLWHRSIALGPVRFRKGTGDFGGLKHFSIRVSLGDLVYQRLLVKDIRIEGLDVALTQDKEGAFAINGVPLPQETETVAKEAESEASTWVAGINSLDVRESRVSFVDADGGKLTADVERLMLAGFRPWEKDTSGVASLAARVNDIALDVQADARPFAEARQGRFEINLQDADLAKIERFTGPLKLARSAGKLTLSARGTATAEPSGGIVLAASGRADLAGLDMATADGRSAACGSAGVDFDLHGQANRAGDGRAAGTLSFSLGDGALASNDGTGLRLPAVNLGVPDLVLSWQADGSLKITATPEIAVDRLDLEGPARLASGPLSVKLPSTTLDLDAKGLTLATKPSVAVKELRIEEPLRASAASVTLDPGEVTLETASDRTSLDAAAGVRVEQFSLDGPAAVTSALISLDLPRLALQTEGDTLTLHATGKLDVAPATALLGDPAGGEGMRADAGALGLAFRDLDLRQTPAETTMSGTLRLDGTALQAVLPYGNAQASFKGESVTINAEPATLAQTAARTALSLRGTAEIGGISADLPAIAGAPAIAASIATVQAAPVDIAASIEQAGTSRFEAHFDTAEVELAASIGNGDLARARLAGVTLTGARVEADGALAADALIVRKPEIDLNERLFSAFAQQPSAAPARSDQGAEPGLRIALGRIAVEDGGTLTFQDGSVRPPLRLKTEVKVLEATDVDTGDPSRQTDIRLDSVVNEFSKVQLLGWIQPFASVPSFDLNGRIGNLELPAFSPYAAQAVGLNLEKGRLSAKLDARAQAGAITGRADLDVDNLGFSALSKEDAARLSAKMGVPIETVVGLLEDSGGRIELGIPVSGDLRSPQFDLSQAIAKAVSGAITAAVTAPFQLLFQPVALVARVATGGGGVAFKPVVFVPGEADLDVNAIVFVDAVAKMLKERPALRLQTCGRATSADLEATLGQTAAAKPGPGQPAPSDRKAAIEAARPALQALAVERGRAVRRRLVDNDGIKSERIGECRATFDAGDQSPPRAEFSF